MRGCSGRVGLVRPRAEILEFSRKLSIKHSRYSMYSMHPMHSKHLKHQSPLTSAFISNYVVLPPLASLLYAYVICHRSSAIGELSCSSQRCPYYFSNPGVVPFAFHRPMAPPPSEQARKASEERHELQPSSSLLEGESKEIGKD